MTTKVARWTHAAGLGMEPVSLEPYRSEAYFELEKERIFKRAWLLVGREEQIANPYDYVVQEVEVAGASILITRDGKGAVRAFHNVCSHRSNQLVWNRKGSARGFKCPYHAWTYKPDGSLAGVPGEADFGGLDKANCGLTPVALAIWEGWLFINLSPEPEIGIEEFLGDFGKYLSGIRYNSAATPVVFTAEMKCNWKVLADAFGESYHIACIHPKTIGGIFASKDNASGKLIDAKFFGSHRSGSMYGDPDYVAPARQRLDRMLLNITNGLSQDVDAEAVADFLSHPAVNPARSNTWSLDVNWMFPNTQLDINPGGVITHQFWPITKDTSRYEARFYMPTPKSMRTRLQQDHFIARIMETVLEDLSNVERTQKAINSGGKSHIHLQDNEVLIRHSLSAVDKWVRSETVREAISA